MDTLDEWTRSGIMPGVSLLVEQDGKVLIEEASGYANVERKIPTRATDIWVTASLAKPVAATAMMQLVDRNEVDLNQPVHDLLPEFDHQDVLIRHLLTHSSGLGPMEPEPQMIEKLGRVRAISNEGLLFDPGTKCSYSTPAFDLIEAIVCQRSGISWTEYTSRYIFHPLGMHETSYDPLAAWEERIPTVYDERDRVDPWWNNRDLRPIGLAGGGLFSGLRDLAAFARAFLQNGYPILSPESCREMLTLQTKGLLNLEGLPQTWGLGWYLNQDGGNGFGPLSHKAFGHGGITGTWMCGDPERKLIVVKLANRLHIPLEESIQMQHRLFTAIVENL